MTKEQYEQKKQEIKARLGEPEWEFDRTPLNECAKELSNLKSVYHTEAMAAKRNEMKQNNAKLSPEGLNEIYQEGKSRLKPTNVFKMPSIVLEEADLEGFQAQEKDILRSYYENRALNTQELALRHKTSRQRVAALLNSKQVDMLDARLFAKLIPSEVRMGLFRLIRNNDSKTVIRLAEETNIIKPEETTVNIKSKPIDDPKALEMLKQLGDKLANDTDVTKE